jgi:hypothetical protein
MDRADSAVRAPGLWATRPLAEEDFLGYKVPRYGWQAFHNLNEDGQAVVYFSLFLFHLNEPQ